MMTFTWSNESNAAFIATCHESGGSGNVSAELENTTRPNGNKELGRYPRNYCQEDGDAPGRLVRFTAEMRNVGGTKYTILREVPFGNAQEQDAAYQLLASAGCNLNDMTVEESNAAKAARNI